ncbi:MAG TPA: GatB/YqeY domain-containing protein [Roseiflexaceae bacterium]|nr:GatB/YqeY domain-containing protein [Roseiflexaceae bacterium]
MNIQEQLQQDLKTAMRAGEKPRVEVIRMALAALKNAQLAMVEAEYNKAVAAAPKTTDANGHVVEPEITLDRNMPLSETAMQQTMAKEVKRRRDAAEMYRKGSREDLAAQEESEVAILEQYLPRQQTADELRPQLALVIQELGASSIADMGKIMPVLMQRFKGQADGRVISQLARELLTQQ